MTIKGTRGSQREEASVESVNDYGGEPLFAGACYVRRRAESQTAAVCQFACELPARPGASQTTPIASLILVTNHKAETSSDLSSCARRQFTRLIPLSANLNEIILSLCVSRIWTCILLICLTFGNIAVILPFLFPSL